MTYFPVIQPYTVFTDLSGDPLENGYIYIGEANLNPITNPITVTWDVEGLYPAAQPIRTIGGIADRNGSPGRIFVNAGAFEDYSILINDKNGERVYYSRTTRFDTIAGGNSVDTISDLRAISGYDQPIYVRGHTAVGDGGQDYFEWTDGAAPGTYVDDDGVIIVPAGGDGSGAWLRQYTGDLNLKAYGITGDISAALSSAVDVKISEGGGTIVIPPGSWSMSANVTLAAGLYIKGEGITDTVITAATDISPLSWSSAIPGDINGGGLHGVTLRGSGAGVTLLEVSNIWGFQLTHCRIYGNSDVGRAIKFVDYSFEAAIMNCRITDYSTYGIEFATTGSVYPNDTHIWNCDFSPNDGGTSIYNPGANSLKIDGNHFEFAADLGGKHIDINGAIRNKIVNNQIGANYYPSAIASIHLRGASDKTVITGNSMSLSHEYCVLLEGTFNFATISDNVVVIDDSNVVGAETKGFVHINGRSEVSCIGNQIEIVRDSVTEGVFHLDNSGQMVSIVGNSIRGISLVVATGIKCESNTNFAEISGNLLSNLSVGIEINKTGTTKTFVVSGNQFVNVTAEISVASYDAVYIRDNTGFITQAKGLATIPNGATTVTVAHGLDITPSATDVLVWAYGTSTNDPGPFWVQTTDATNITINCRNDPGASGFPIRWKHVLD